MIYIDVTNLMVVDFLSGIQRVVREVTIRLLQEKDLEIALFIQENDLFKEINNEDFYNYFKNNINKKKDIRVNKTFSVEEIRPGSILFELDSVWNTTYKRSLLYPLLKNRGVKIVTYIYDIIPVFLPKFFHTNTLYNFLDYFGANIQYADAFIVSTKSVLDSIYSVTDKLKLPRIPGFVSWLGADFVTKPSDSTVNDKVLDYVSKDRKYILIVGTLEPRKNHKVLLDAFDKELFDKGIDLVIAGRVGWNIKETEKRIRNHTKLNNGLYFFEGLNDASIDTLYKNAFFTAFPTYDEGFGLPMIESFQRGIPVIASDIPVLREVGKNLSIYFKLNDADSFINTLLPYIENNKKYVKLKDKVSKYIPFTWDQTTSRIVKALKKYESLVKIKNKSVEQIVILSARINDILNALPFIENLMPFIKELVLCCPDGLKDDFIKEYSGNLKVTFLTDSELLKNDKLPKDHAKRNFFLRSLMMRRPEINDLFIMSDDDYRPLEKIDISTFIDNDKYFAYYCGFLDEYEGDTNNPSSYDKAMFNILNFLKNFNYPTYQFSSHMPQIIDKKKYIEFLDTHPNIETSGIDEWSGYFNWMLYKYPNLVEIRPYISMCWPAEHTSWDIKVVPGEYKFENYYETLYEDKKIFSKYSKEYNGAILKENIEKKKTYKKSQDKYLNDRKIYTDYTITYKEKYREFPSLCIRCKEDCEIHLPSYINLPRNGFVRIPLLISKEFVSGNRDIKISYQIEGDGRLLTRGDNIVDINISKDSNITLPIFTFEKEKIAGTFTIIVDYDNRLYSKSMKANLI